MNSQVAFENIWISTGIWLPNVIVAGDMDGDGYNDAIFGGQGDQFVTWFKNVDGTGNIQSSTWVGGWLDGLYEIIVVDIDNDNDLDVVATSSNNNQIAWFENLDGLGDFGGVSHNEIIISNQELRPHGLFAADMDGDGDMDILSTSDSSPNFNWYENLDGQGNFGPGKVIIENASAAPRRVRAFDIDGDGDNDALITEAGSNGNISWAENLGGAANFGPKTLVSQVDFSVGWVEIIDFDHDNDLDIIAIKDNQNFTGEILLFANDGIGSFNSPQILTSIDNALLCVFPVDFDNDNDYDLVFSGDNSNGNGFIHWSENQGDGTFGPNILISDKLVDDTRSIYPSDLDYDGDMDFLATSYESGKVAWYKNTITLGVNDISTNKFIIEPNPTSGKITITSNETLKQIQVYNNVGQLLAFNTNKKDIDISHLNSGLYFITILNEKNEKVTKKVIKQ